jgi:hypothetical protein
MCDGSAPLDLRHTLGSVLLLAVVCDVGRSQGQSQLPGPAVANHHGGHGLADRWIVPGSSDRSVPDKRDIDVAALGAVGEPGAHAPWVVAEHSNTDLGTSCQLLILGNMGRGVFVHVPAGHGSSMAVSAGI